MFSVFDLYCSSEDFHITQFKGRVLGAVTRYRLLSLKTLPEIDLQVVHCMPLSFLMPALFEVTMILLHNRICSPGFIFNKSGGILSWHCMTGAQHFTLFSLKSGGPVLCFPGNCSRPSIFRWAQSSSSPADKASPPSTGCSLGLFLHGEKHQAAFEGN